MDDWKTQFQERVRKREEERQNSLKTEQKKHEALEQELRKQCLVKLGQDFKCHVCGKPAKKPKLAYISYGEGAWGNDNYSSYEDFSEPGDHTKCDICKEWACEDHIIEVEKSSYWKQNICKACAEKL